MSINTCSQLQFISTTITHSCPSTPAPSYSSLVLHSPTHAHQHPLPVTVHYYYTHPLMSINTCSQLQFIITTITHSCPSTPTPSYSSLVLHSPTHINQHPLPVAVHYYYNHPFMSINTHSQSQFISITLTHSCPATPTPSYSSLVLHSPTHVHQHPLPVTVH